MISEFFSKSFSGGPFVLFSTSHLVALLGIAVVIFFVVRLRSDPDEGHRKAWRYTMAAVLVINETSWHLWNLTTGQWNIQTMLPLHLCSALVWLSAYMLVKKSYRIYEFAYLLGIAGALQAILTPDLGIYDFPHYRYFQVFVSHGLIVSAAIYMTIVEGYRPTLGSLKRVFIGSNLYMIVVTAINFAIGSNYLYTAHKPATASLIDVLGPWPWYLLAIEGIGIISVLLLYLPFAIRDIVQSRNPNPA